MAGQRSPLVRPQMNLHATPNDVVIKNDLGVDRAAEHYLAHRREMIEDIILFGLEGKSGDEDRSHERPVAKLDRRRVQVADIGETVSSMRFALAPGRRSQ